MDLVDPVPVGEEVGQEHDPPSASAVQRNAGVGGLNVGPGAVDEEGVRHIGQAGPVFTVDLDRIHLEVVQGPTGHGNTAPDGRACPGGIEDPIGFPRRRGGVDVEGDRHRSGRVGGGRVGDGDRPRVGARGESGGVHGDGDVGASGPGGRGEGEPALVVQGRPA